MRVLIYMKLCSVFDPSCRVYIPAYPGTSMLAMKSNPEVMVSVRSFLGGIAAHEPVDRFSDDEVIRLLERLLDIGYILIQPQIVVEEKKEQSGGGGPAPAAGPEDTPPPARQPQSASRAPEPDPATFDSNINGEAQAQALIHAAASGVPFCPT